MDSILENVYCNLAIQIGPNFKDSFWYALRHMNNYSEWYIVYFLKQNSDGAWAPGKDLAEIETYRSVKSITIEFACKMFE